MLFRGLCICNAACIFLCSCLKDDKAKRIETLETELKEARELIKELQKANLQMQEGINLQWKIG